jgi:ABC-type Zn2+ transport system substrate-binding protein/surface adhesin
LCAKIKEQGGSCIFAQPQYLPHLILWRFVVIDRGEIVMKRIKLKSRVNSWLKNYRLLLGPGASLLTLPGQAMP